MATDDKGRGKEHRDYTGDTIVPDPASNPNEPYTNDRTPFDGDGVDDEHKVPNTNIKARGGIIADVVLGDELKKERLELARLAENEQVSVKEGMRSGAQKRSASRFELEPVYPPRRVAGAYGRKDARTVPGNRQGAPRNRRGKAS